jgi:hypothetical protein
VPLPKFCVVCSEEEDGIMFLARVELEAENDVSSYSHPEHDACSKCLLNGRGGSTEPGV